MQLANLEVDKTKLSALCHKHGVVKLSVFGSSLRSDFDSQRSDVDVLVEFAADANKSLFTLLEIQHELAKLLGKRVDLTTPGSLSKYFREEVVSSAEVLYEQA